jgi:endonuclease/exonuclease/phosphatase family metal-dependent hydrolase
MRLNGAWTTAAVALAGLAAAGGAAEGADGPTLKVMSYNIRYASPLGANSWPVRRPLLKRLIESHSPDVIGTQEGLYGQLKDMENDLANYRWIGLGRDGGSRGEFMAIFYKADRFEPLEYDHYWLSDTPDAIGSTSWGNSVRRMTTWVKLRDRSAKQDFYVVNTHFDHQVEEARRRSAKLLWERSERLGERLPVVLTGDFNCAAGSSEAYRTLVAPGRFRDAWEDAERVGERTRSFNGFQHPAPKEGPRIDWILHRGPIRAVEIFLDDFAEGSQYPSDHFPVVAVFQYGE